MWPVCKYDHQRGYDRIGISLKRVGKLFRHSNSSFRFHFESPSDCCLLTRTLTFSFKIRSWVFSPVMCIKWDSAILFSLILSWQPCNTALLHNWIATLGTVSRSSPTKSRKKRERLEGEACSPEIRFNTKAEGWGFIVRVNEEVTPTWLQRDGNKTLGEFADFLDLECQPQCNPRKFII